MSDKSKMLIMMMGKKKPEEPDEETDDSSIGSEGLRSAMEDFLKAVEEKNPDAMVDAFCNAVDLHESEDYDSKDKESSDYDEG